MATHVPDESRLNSKSLGRLPTGPMLRRYLNSPETVDKLVAAANKRHEREVKGGAVLGDNNVTVKRLDNFMGKKTDKKTLKDGHKDAARMGSKA